MVLLGHQPVSSWKAAHWLAISRSWWGLGGETGELSTGWPRVLRAGGEPRLAPSVGAVLLGGWGGALSRQLGPQRSRLRAGDKDPRGTFHL